ncbi:uncharacterized protein LOC134178564 [Corticium candelabrum]|uniref:uncharacterized protein LOC134178564 n=1 Tax=Corticium candelabrum TaxID=121492 RepID=UPI002E264E7A|nr:uncharacterized protein LOC134178564 [Corticium candelabrum]
MGGSYSRLGCVRSHQDDHQLDGSDERGFGVTLMNPVKSVDSASTHSSSSRQSRATYVYESDWSDVVAMKRKWEEDYALTEFSPKLYTRLGSKWLLQTIALAVFSLY